MGSAELPPCVPTCEPVASRSQKFLKFKSSLRPKRLYSSSSESQNCGGAPRHQVWDQAPTRRTGLHHRGEQTRNKMSSCVFFFCLFLCVRRHTVTFPSPCVGPGQHPASGRGLQQFPGGRGLGLHHVVQQAVGERTAGKKSRQLQNKTNPNQHGCTLTFFSYLCTLKERYAVLLP